MVNNMSMEIVINEIVNNIYNWKCHNYISATQISSVILMVNKLLCSSMIYNVPSDNQALLI